MDDHVSAPKKPSDSDKSSGGRTAGTALLVPLFLFMALMWFREAIREHPVTFEASRYENFSNRGLSFQYKLTNTTKKPIEVVDVETRFRVKGQEGEEGDIHGVFAPTFHLKGKLLQPGESLESGNSSGTRFLESTFDYKNRTYPVYMVGLIVKMKVDGSREVIDKQWSNFLELPIIR